MAEVQNEINYREIYDMGHGLIIAEVNISDLKEQDINARIMKPEMMNQLTENIKKRGQLESLPFCALEGNKIEIVSGHHRIKAARAAGMDTILVILDISGMSRSQLAAKQLAHNAISGFDDDSTIREIVKMIEDVDDMLESYIGKEILEEPLSQFEKMAAPAVQFDFKNIVFTFLPHQIKDFSNLVKSLETASADIVGIANYEECQAFIETLSKYQQFTDIRNVGAAVHSMIESASEKMESAGFDGSDESEWTYLSKIFGSNAVPKESAEVIKQALKKAEKAEVIGKKKRWQLIEYLAADYLAG